MPKIELKNICKYYVDKKSKSATAVLYQLNGVIPDGQFTVIMGESGCGKTTLLKAIAGLLPIEEGEILFDGENITNSPPAKRNLSYMSQEYALYPHMTVFDNVAYPLKLAHIDDEEIRRRVNETLEMLNLTLLSSRRPRQLSGGQQQRVALARALVKRPQALLLDEPLSNVEETLKKPLMQDFLQLQQKLGITFVYVTHNVAEARTLANYLVVMSNGEIIESDLAKNLFLKQSSYLYKNFVATSKMPAKKQDDTDEIV